MFFLGGAPQIKGTPQTAVAEEETPLNQKPEDGSEPGPAFEVTDNNLATTVLSVDNGVISVDGQGPAPTITIPGSEDVVNGKLPSLKYTSNGGNKCQPTPDTLTITATDTDGKQSTEKFAINIQPDPECKNCIFCRIRTAYAAPVPLYIGFDLSLLLNERVHSPIPFSLSLSLSRQLFSPEPSQFMCNVYRLEVYKLNACRL